MLSSTPGRSGFGAGCPSATAIFGCPVFFSWAVFLCDTPAGTRALTVHIAQISPSQGRPGVPQGASGRSVFGVAQRRAGIAGGASRGRSIRDPPFPRAGLRFAHSHHGRGDARTASRELEGVLRVAGRLGKRLRPGESLQRDILRRVPTGIPSNRIRVAQAGTEREST